MFNYVFYHGLTPWNKSLCTCNCNFLVSSIFAIKRLKNVSYTCIICAVLCFALFTKLLNLPEVTNAPYLPDYCTSSRNSKSKPRFVILAGQRSAAMMAAFSRTPGKHPCLSGLSNLNFVSITSYVFVFSCYDDICHQ